LQKLCFLVASMAMAKVSCIDVRKELHRILKFVFILLGRRNLSIYSSDLRNSLVEVYWVVRVIE